MVFLFNKDIRMVAFCICRNLSYFAMSFFANFRKIIAKEKEIWYYMESNNIATYVAIKF